MSIMIIKMLSVVLLLDAAVVVLWLLIKNTAFGKISVVRRQIVIGLLFGGLAVLSTHFGIHFENMTLNVRDIAPLSAGLIFGPLAGILAGLIGGIERFIVGTWFAVGSYTTVACTMSTIMAGFIAAALRVYLFDRKMPQPVYGLVIGGIMEVFHMISVFITHINDVKKAYSVIETCALPMIIFTALGVWLALLLVNYFSRGYVFRLPQKDRKTQPISKTFQLWLLLFISGAVVLTCSFTFILVTKMTTEAANDQMQAAADDIVDEIEETQTNYQLVQEKVRDNALVTARAAKQIIGERSVWSTADLAELCNYLKVFEIDLIGSDGFIYASSNADYLGFDMSSGQQSAEFLVLLEDTKEYIQDLQPIAYDSSVSIMYAGVKSADGFLQVGYEADYLAQLQTLADLTNIVADRRVGENGCVVILDNNATVVSGKMGFAGKDSTEIGVAADLLTADNTFAAEVYGVLCNCYCKSSGDYNILLAMPQSEVYYMRNVFAYEIVYMEIILFAVVFVLIYLLVKKIVVDNIHRINQSLSNISNGNLNEVVDINTNEEFVSLSRDINTTVSTLKRYIDEASARIDEELELARLIQLSALPGIYPEREEFELFCYIDTAKEVGGDFYDFFMVDETHLVLVIADVSGKGVPASLFMMKSKTLLKSLAEAGKSPQEIFITANRELCDGNDAEMFVTAWLGILDLETYTMICVNAGHEYPVICHKDGQYELFKDKHGLVLAGMEMSKYREYQLQLQPGDILFVYTDGVPEATDSANNLYGVERMLATLNSYQGELVGLPGHIKADIDGFIGQAPQFDDITMLCLELKDIPLPRTITVVPTEDTILLVTEFAEQSFEALQVPLKIIMKLNIAVDEIFSNIVRYSEAAKAAVSCHVKGGAAILKFIDDGKPYNPLEKDDPDITLSAEEREIGGLGIYMVKQFSDVMDYKYLEGCNILTIKKDLG